MFAGRVMVGGAVAALVAAAAIAMPALGAPEAAQPRAASGYDPLGIDSFTPASADPRLAAIYAREGLDSSPFRFTPAETSRSQRRAITVAVRIRSPKSAGLADATRATPEPETNIGIAPIAYNLGVAVGWKKIALTGDLSKLDVGLKPGSRETMGIGVSYRVNRFTGKLQARTEKSLGNDPAPVAMLPNYSVDIGGAYRLTRNLDVTAGLRYRSERDRLQRLSEDRRDSQAVYLGTAFRF